MESPMSKYKQGHGFGSSKKRFSPSNKHSRPVKFPKDSRHSSFVPTTSRQLHSRELPLHVKRPIKMSSPKISSPKRSRPSHETTDRPSKQRKIEEKDKGPHGVEELLTSQSALALVKPPTISPSEQYHRRQKITTSARLIRQKRALSSCIPSDTEMMPSASHQGMKNLTGVLCYRHSLFQALLHSPKFVNWLLLSHHPDECVVESPDDCVTCALRGLAIAYWAGGNVTEELRFTNKVFKTNRWTSGSLSGQGDPEEQFNWITETVGSQLPKKVFRQFEATHRLVADIGIGCICGYTSKTDAHITGAIPVPLQPKAPGGLLTTYLDRYFNETVSGYRCEKCNNTQDKNRIHSITHFPDTLLIQLKRFDYQGHKDSGFVKIGPTLEMDQFRAGGNREGSSYELSALVVHAGSSKSGHYICVAKCDDGAWRKFNDGDMSPVKLSEVLAHSRSWTPYLLFYQRSQKE